MTCTVRRADRADGPEDQERAQEMLEARFGVAADVWSVTSYKELRRDALAADRYNLLHPDAAPRKPYVTALLEGEPWPVVAVTDSVRLLPEMIQRWVPGGLHPLGTDGFGRSDTREALRRFFEVDAEHICLAALQQLVGRGQLEPARVAQAVRDLGLDPDAPDPWTV